MGDRIGRFERRGVLGAGATGIVHDGFDPTLGRAVAIKVLHGDAVRADPTAGARLLREAQALARLGHPNVVTIHEVGRDGDQVFLVMERIDGATARGWRDAAARTAAEIVEVYRQAGLGLAAAHQAGLIDRDVKPDNILVGADGRTRITDFGLAALGGAAVATGVDGADLDDLPVTETAPLTRSGALIGTPAYMAAEAHRGQAVDARSDQFGFCVALWEALAGALPFAGTTYRERARRVCSDEVEDARAIAPPLAAVLRRGLLADPERRWPSMTALRDAIAEAAAVPAEPVAGPPAPVPRRGARVAVAVSLAASLGGGVTVWRLRGSAAPQSGPPPPAVRAAARPSAALVTDGTSCPFLPAFVDDTTIVFEDQRTAGNGKDLFKLALGAGGTGEPLLARPIDTVRAARGRSPGEALYTSPEGAGAVDSASGRLEALPFRALGAGFGGDAIVYHRAVNSIVREIVGGDDHPLLEMPRHLFPYAMAITTDGRRLAISTHPHLGTPTICLVDRDGTVPPPYTCLDVPDVVAGRPAFSPAGDQLYYATTAGIRRRTLGGTGADELWLPGVLAWGGIDVAPDGRRLIFAGGLTDGDAQRGEIAPMASPALPMVRGYGGNPAGHPSGTWVYTPHGVVVIGVPGQPAVAVTDAALGNAMRPLLDVAGRRAVFAVDGATAGLHVAGLDLPARRITTDAGDENPVWTADGKVAFARVGADGMPRVHVVAADAELAKDATLAPALDGAYMPQDRVPATGELLLRGADGALVLWHLATGALRPLDTGVFGKQNFTHALVSADSRWVIVTSHVGQWKLPITLPGQAAPGVAERLPAPAIGLCDFVDRAGMDRHGEVWLAIQRGRTDLFLVELSIRPAPAARYDVSTILKVGIRDTRLVRPMPSSAVARAACRSTSSPTRRSCRARR